MIESIALTNFNEPIHIAFIDFLIKLHSESAKHLFIQYTRGESLLFLKICAS